MRIRFIIILVSLISLSLSALTAQTCDNNVALTINGKAISLDEIQRDYRNREVLEGESIQDFINSYIQKKLIIEEAISQRIDTTETYQREFRIYQQQLLNSYLADTITSKNLLDKIANRYKYELELNHAFVPFDKELIFPRDTISAYQESLRQREIAINKGFSKINDKLNNNSFGVILDVNTETGYLGWIRPLMFPLELDDIIFSLEVGKITMPVRGKTGYHIFQVVDKRPARGTPVVEQVMFNFPVVPPTKKAQDSVYNVAIKTYDEVVIRGNFQEICDEFSKVFNTGDRGCLLGRVDLGEKIPYNLIRAAYDLENIGDVSEPIYSDYGYHILRLKETLPTPSDEQVRQALQKSINSSSILPSLTKERRVNLLNETDIKFNSNSYEKLLKISADHNPHDSLFFTHVKNTSDLLFSIGDKSNSYTVQNFLDHIKATSWLYTQKAEDELMPVVKYQPVVTYTLSTDILNNYLESFMYAMALQYKKQQLETNNSNYKLAIQDLSNGLFYTTLLDKEIWKKTKTDYDGLQNTFLKNRDNYTLNGKYFKGLIVHCKNKNTADEIERKYNDTLIPAKYLRKQYNKDEVLVDIDEGLWQQGDNEYVDSKIYHVNNKEARRNFPYYVVIGQFITSPHDFTDVKAQVERDYQQVLEKEWMQHLKEKYKVEVNKNLIKKIK